MSSTALGDKIDGSSVSKMRCVTLSCLAAKWKIDVNGKKGTSNCLSRWLEEFIVLIGMERAAATLRHLDLGLEGLQDIIRSYLNSSKDYME